MAQSGWTIINVADHLREVHAKTVLTDAGVVQDSDTPSLIPSTVLLTSNQQIKPSSRSNKG